jgi:hypothetical protein
MGTDILTRRLWTKERAKRWYAKQPWIAGANFTPSSAINELEMWQADTFDPATIDRELGWAAGIGMNAMRVFLHYLPWRQDPKGFKSRLKRYLSISWKHRIRTMFVFFDDCWLPDPTSGKQPEPRPGVHNSGWLQCPGQKQVTDTSLLPVLEAYVKDILRTFKRDRRVLMWDLYNEPGNSNHGNETLPLLTSVCCWARTVDPSQPLTMGLWNDSLAELVAFQSANSDVISFHNYSDADNLRNHIGRLKTSDRPLVCTEYVARGAQSLFQTCMPVLKAEKVGAINWGLVAGKTQTIWAWGSPEQPGKTWDSIEPELWHHDIFRRDGSPYDPGETKLIRDLTSSL